MAIIRYEPPKRKIIDHRNDNGGYYVAICEACNTTFYPKRVNAKYCCSNCRLDSHRKSKAEILASGGSGGTVKTPKTLKETVKASEISEKDRIAQLIIRAKMKLKAAQKNYDDYLNTCAKEGSDSNKEIAEIERLERIVITANNEYKSLVKNFR